MIHATASPAAISTSIAVTNHQYSSAFNIHLARLVALRHFPPTLVDNFSTDDRLPADEMKTCENWAASIQAVT